MAKVKGWTKVINSQQETQWQSDNGKIVRVNSAFIPTKSGGHGWELYGTNHISMEKYSYNRKELEKKAVEYMKKTIGYTPRGWRTIFYNKPVSQGGVKIGELRTKEHTSGKKIALDYFNNVVNKNKKYNTKTIVVDVKPMNDKRSL